MGASATSKGTRSEPAARVLVTDGSSLSARQVITALGRRGAVVDVVDPSSMPLGRFSRFVRAVHRVPAYGSDPWGWFDATLKVLARVRHDVLLPVHEQTAVLARAPEPVRELGVGLAVPAFDALRRVQDKANASETLRRAGLKQPATRIATTAAEVTALGDELPLYLKARIGTATAGVFYATDATSLETATSQLLEQLAFEHGGVLVQQPLEGELVMAQAVFDGGVLVAHHANLRARPGASGGASHKRSVSIPGLTQELEALGRELRWHGALSLDAIRTEDGLHYIDVNPRLVEPGNAERAGVDLVGALLDLARGRAVEPGPAGRAGVGTHQLLIAILGAAETGRGRRGVASELAQAVLHRGDYAGSREELTPVTEDPKAALPLGAMAAALLAKPEAHKQFTGGAIAGYALTARGWREICAGRAG